MRSMSSASAALSALRSPQTRTSSSSVVVEVGEERGADGVKCRDDPDALGDHLLGLLGGRALPARRACAWPCRRSRRRAARWRRPGAGSGDERVLEVGQRLRLGAKRHAEDDDLGALHRLGVLGAAERRVGDRAAARSAASSGPAGVARADHHRHAGAPEAQRRGRSRALPSRRLCTRGMTRGRQSMDRRSPRRANVD